MKRGNKSKVSLILVLAVAVFFAMPVKTQAASDTAVKLGNVLGNGVSTVINGIIRGKVHNFSDGLKMFLYGGASGYGFYQAKKMVSSNKVTAGVMLAQLSASVAENVSMGENPLAYIGYSFGFTRIRVATPLARNPDSVIGLDISARELVNLALAFSRGGKPVFRNGMIGFEAPMAKNNVLGWTNGLFATTTLGTGTQVYGHEMVHVVQNLQLQSQTMYEPFLKSGDSGSKRKMFRFKGIRLDTMGTISDLTSVVQGYDSQWKEKEAYHFSGN